MALDCRARPGLPQRMVPLDKLKRLLASDTTARPVRDDVWRELVHHARHDGPAWVVAAVGVALPGLKRRAGRLARGRHGDAADVESDLLARFIERLDTLDITGPDVCRRLIDGPVCGPGPGARAPDGAPASTSTAPPCPRHWPGCPRELSITRSVTGLDLLQGSGRVTVGQPLPDRAAHRRNRAPNREQWVVGGNRWHHDHRPG